MEIKECFLVLGIEQVKDERQIKNAYREKLAVTNPEDDPEGFKRLRNAYEMACQYAQSPDEEAAQEERDTSPSGVWVEQAAFLYKNIKLRCDLPAWEELFKDEIFESLEEEENCRVKMLRFLMDHFRLPSEVWKLLDQKLHLTQDAAQLRERFPVDFINFVLHRCDRGEDIEFSLFEGAQEADYDLYMNYYDSCWRALQDEKLDEAAKLLSEAEGIDVYHPVMDVCRGHLYELQEKLQEAISLMRALYEKYPTDDMVCYHTAEIIWKHGDKKEAAEIFQAIKDRHEKHYMANYRLTEWNYEIGEYATAKKCAEAVLSAGAEDAFLEILTKVNAKLEHDMYDKWKQSEDWSSALELCWCYLQDGATSKGIRLAKEIEGYITDEKRAEYTGLMAKLYIEEADYEAAIAISEVWEKELEKKLASDESEEEKEKDKDRIMQAYMIRMQCYRALGHKEKSNFAKAIEQIEAVETGTPKDIGLLLEKAQIFMEMEEYEKSLEITSKLVEEYQVYAACATAMEVYKRQWIAGGVVQNASICIQQFPTYVRAYEVLGRVFLDLEEQEELEKMLETAKENKIESPYLDAYRYLMNHKPPQVEELNQRLDEFQKEYYEKVENGQMFCFEPGLKLMNEYLNWYPGPYMLRRRASYYKAAMEYEKALADYERALADEPGNAYIYANMSSIYTLQGDFEKALVHMKRAILYAAGEEWANILQVHIAKIYMHLGDYATALSWFEAYEKIEPQETGHMKHMATCLARLGNTALAKKKLYGYYHKNDDEFYDGYYSNVFDIYTYSGEWETQKEWLAEWKCVKKVGEPKKFSLLPLKKNENLDAGAVDYFAYAGWQALFVGDGKSAIEFMEEHYRLKQKMKGSGIDSGLMDLIFAAILHGDDKTGKNYAEKMQLFLNRQSLQAVEKLYDMPKSKACYKFLAEYYTADNERLQEILDQGRNCPYCDFCVWPVCVELEAMQLLLDIKCGKLEEARNRIAEITELTPNIDYMLSISAVLENKQKD